VNQQKCVDAKNGQITPAPQTGSPPNLMTAAQLARFKRRAITDGRYYSECPTNDGGGYNLSGPVVWIEGCPSSDTPNLASNVQTVPCAAPAGMSPSCDNVANAPGIIIWHCGRADIQGAWTHRGILYMVNNSDGTCDPSLPARGDGTCVGNGVNDARDVLNTNGGFGVWGAIAVDGLACIKVGSNGMQVVFDGNVFDSAASYGTVGLVQNTWRELSPRDA
jgi:hypothetical protein